MQTTGSFPQLNQGQSRSLKPQSSSGPSIRKLQSTTPPIVPKRRRQLTPTAPNLTTNPYSKLTALLGNAIKGRGIG